MRIAVVALLAIALSGCFGIPEGSADFGDTVAIDYVVVDPVNHAPLVWSLDTVPVTDVDGTPHYNGVALRSQVMTRLGGAAPAGITGFFVPVATGGYQAVDKASFDNRVMELGLMMSFAVSKEFVLGDGESGLGFDVERGLIGLGVNDTATIRSDDDPSRGFSKTVRKGAELGGGDVMRSIPRAQFEGSLGAPSVGMIFQLDQVVSAEVISFDNDTVESRVTLQDGEDFDAAIVGSKVVARVGPTKYTFMLEPTEGETFSIQANPLGTPLDLPAGTYKSIGVDGDQAVWAFSSTPAALVETPIQVHVLVTDVKVSKATVPEGDYGVRTSPVLPHVEVIRGHGAEPHGDAGHSDDGHSHNGHTH